MLLSHIECLVHYLLPEHDLPLRWTSATSFFAYGYIDSSQAVCCDMTAGHVWICLLVCLPLFSSMDRVRSEKKKKSLCVCFHRANTHTPIYQINKIKSQ